MRDKDLFETIASALDASLEGDELAADVMEVLSTLTALMALDVGISASRLLYCFSATVGSVYDNDEEEDDEIAIH